MRASGRRSRTQPVDSANRSVRGLAKAQLHEMGESTCWWASPMKQWLTCGAGSEDDIVPRGVRAAQVQDQLPGMRVDLRLRPVLAVRIAVQRA